MKTNKIKIIMVGAFPPPVHGMAVVNAAVLARLKDMGEAPLVLNLAASTLDRSLLSRFGRLPRVFRGLLHLSCMRRLRGKTLYISISGGFGQIYELLFLFIARFRGMRVFLHHHCFAYLDRYNLISRVLFSMAGSQAVHITLSQGMAGRLLAMYPGVKRTASVSNAIFVIGEASCQLAEKSNLEVIGFLGNIAPEKGVFDFLDVCDDLQEKGVQIKAKLAGPFQDPEVESTVRQRLTKLPSVECLGPVYGADKKTFFKTIDLLLFPTRYVNEAEPLTIHEAMAAGLPVISYGRGAIPEIVSESCGLVVANEDDFVAVAVAQIETWLAVPSAYRDVCEAATDRFNELQRENIKQWESLKTQIMCDT